MSSRQVNVYLIPSVTADWKRGNKSLHVLEGLLDTCNQHSSCDIAGSSKTTVLGMMEFDKIHLSHPSILKQKEEIKILPSGKGVLLSSPTDQCVH